MARANRRSAVTCAHTGKTIGIAGCIAVLFVILKLDKVLDWEWSVVFVPLWVINSIFLCADVVLVIQVVNAMREAQVSHNRIEYAGRLAAFVFLLNILVIPGIASEILVTVNGLRAIVRVSPLILSYVIIFLVVVIDRVISVTVYIEQLLSKWDTRSKLREYREHLQVAMRTAAAQVESLRYELDDVTGTSNISNHLRLTETPWKERHLEEEEGEEQEEGENDRSTSYIQRHQDDNNSTEIIATPASRAALRLYRHISAAETYNGVYP